MRIETFSKRNWRGKRRWYFRIRAANHRIIAQSEAYNSPQARDDTARRIKDEAGSAEIVAVLA